VTPPSEKYLQAAAFIGKAESVDDLDRATKAIDSYVVKGDLTSDEWSRLTDAINEKYPSLHHAANPFE
jgi:polyhydroxyalkanoate synthesis regulator phasin